MMKDYLHFCVLVNLDPLVCTVVAFQSCGSAASQSRHSVGSVGKATVLPCTVKTTTAEGTALDTMGRTTTAEKGEIRIVRGLSISVVTFRGSCTIFCELTIKTGPLSIFFLFFIKLAEKKKSISRKYSEGYYGLKSISVLRNSNSRKLH